MKIRLRGEWAIVWVITVCAAVAGAQSVYSASEPSVWLQNGAVKKSLVADNMSLTDQIVVKNCQYSTRYLLQANYHIAKFMIVVGWQRVVVHIDQMASAIYT